ncbi:oxidoreductase [Segetibacter sp. 3557_3]|uniref:Gfo/Idh/MocA family oxidoreductase n=1 Tax=Segetibacter sp. 3557_3 TaxID=2547429 RepID=UPI0010590162|nr:Gfo/Idh/MocA family oxidoreductase [Segetibacter sp. 3557_3]TDH27762.1 oxidoreductase [Segetibacter sp. 3557_3]
MIPIQSAICSFGMSGKVFHAPFLHTHKGFNFYGAWERSKKVVGEFYPGVKSFDTLEAMLADPGIELVIVNTPNYSHYEYCRQALLAGKHVLVEKPFVATTAEAVELVELAKRQGKVLTVYQNRRFDSDYLTVKQVVQEGLLGEVVEAEFHFDRYNLNLSPKQHKETPGPCTGVVYDLGSHILDQALDLFGSPEAIFADITNFRPQSKVDDYFELLMYYPGKRVRLKATYVAREPFPSFVVHGSRGSFLKSRADIQEPELVAGKMPGVAGWGVEPEAEQGLLHTEINGQVIREPRFTLAGDYSKLYDQLYEAIRNGAQPLVTGNEAIRLIQIIEAAYESSRERRVVEIRD